MIPPTAIARWERDDAQSWAAVRTWMLWLSRGIKIIVAPPIHNLPEKDVKLPSP
jgi:hypothetical protein